MTIIIDVRDKNGKLIRLTKERWDHISREHPEVVSVVYNFEEVLKKPTKLVSYPYDESIKYFYRHFKDTSKNLLLVVKYLNGDGFIITAYFVRDIK